MSLRDGLKDHISGLVKTILVNRQVDQQAAIGVAQDDLISFIERALAAERAATIEECASAANDQAAIAQIAAEKRYGKPAGDLSEDEDHFLHEAAMAEEVARTILALPRNRSALAEALQERTNQVWQHAVQHATDQAPEGPSCSCDLCFAVERRLAQARREQQAGLKKVLYYLEGFITEAEEAGGGDRPFVFAAKETVAAIRAQEG